MMLKGELFNKQHPAVTAVVKHANQEPGPTLRKQKLPKNKPVLSHRVRKGILCQRSEIVPFFMNLFCKAGGVMNLV